MGTWGPSPFDNDDAAEWCDHLVRRKSKQPIKKALQAVIKPNEPEADICFPALAAAAIVSAAHDSLAKLPADIQEWVTENDYRPDPVELKLATQAVAKIRENSELAQMASDYGDWQKVTKALLAKLKKQSVDHVQRRRATKSPAPKKSNSNATEKLLKQLEKKCTVERAKNGTVVRICDYGLLTDALLRDLLPLSSTLKVLELKNTYKITDRGLETIAAMKGIEVLDLDSIKSITDDGLVHVTAMPALRKLSLFHSPLITDKAINHLKQLAHLQELCLFGTRVSLPAAEHLKQHLPKLTKLLI